MNKILIAASIVGAAAAGVIIYLRTRTKGDPENALDHANHVAKSHIRKVNHKVKEALA